MEPAGTVGSGVDTDTSTCVAGAATEDVLELAIGLDVTAAVVNIKLIKKIVPSISGAMLSISR